MFRFHPRYKERVWGGRAFSATLGRSISDECPIGESWEIVDRPDDQSIETETGKSLRELIEANPDAIMGPGYDPSHPFPVLVKWLDCSQRLSLQVHPPSDVADELGGEPKTECWFIADATEHAALFVGIRKGTDRARFERAISDETLEPLLHRIPVVRGQAMLLQAGRLHAIDGGNLILEIQQNSDTTYRVYDWGRTGLDGQPRDLHVAESLQSINFEDIEPEPQAAFMQPGQRTVADCPEFRIRQFNLEPGQGISFGSREQPRIVSLVEGRLSAGEVATHIQTSENVLIPYCESLELKAGVFSTLLVTDNFI